MPGAPLVGVFVAWAIGRGLLGASRFAAHQAREAVRTRFVREALPRGLWNAAPEGSARPLRERASDWFGGRRGLSATRDFIALLGSRKNVHGHDERVLDEAGWDAVDRASPMLEERLRDVLG